MTISHLQPRHQRSSRVSAAAWPLHWWSRSLLALVFLFVALLAVPAFAQVTAFKQAVAEAASEDDAIAAFYRDAGYAQLWTGQDDIHKARRAALIEALENVTVHGLPRARYDADGLIAQMRDVRSIRDLGLVEVALSRAFVTYARDVQSGVLVPSTIDKDLAREITYRDRRAYLDDLADSGNPRAYFRALPPSNLEYRALMREKMRLEALVAKGGWGRTVPVSKLEPGDSGPAVIALRDRLVAMGYMRPTAGTAYDTRLEQAVQRFQLANGLEADGVAGKTTITEMNRSAAERLKSVVVAMERERWMPRERGTRHVLVNQTDFTAKIVDNGNVTFRTRSVVGKNLHDQRSPEFSDVMEHMIINPSWHVPRSIMTKEYLPQLQNNPNAASHLIITDRSGRRVNREEMDFTQFTRANFPFDMRQPPGGRNALGLVKFMFPNKHNIYLHDTPHKSLFKRETRAFSHGCIRLQQPFDFAYTLLERQTDDPEGYFKKVLSTGRETKVPLEQPIPVHLVYRTAFATPRGEIEFRRDIYGRDAKIWKALQDAGVALEAIQG